MERQKNKIQKKGATVTEAYTRRERIKEENNERNVEKKQAAPTARKENAKHVARQK